MLKVTAGLYQPSPCLYATTIRTVLTLSPVCAVFAPHVYVCLQAAGVNWAAVESFIDMGGVRIEDNVVVTRGGHFNLTTATGLPKAAADIEACMAELKRGRHSAAAAAMRHTALN